MESTHDEHRCTKWCPLEARFWSYVTKEPDGCWLWTGADIDKGYGRMMVAGRRVLVHRLSLELAGVELDPALTVDHLCRVKHCVNPAHLEQVPLAENLRRKARAVTHCPQGHPYSEENTYVSKAGARHCRECGRRRSLAAYYKRKSNMGE